MVTKVQAKRSSDEIAREFLGCIVLFDSDESSFQVTDFSWGSFVEEDRKKLVYSGTNSEWDIDEDMWSYFEVMGIVKDMGYVNVEELWYKIGGKEFNVGLKQLVDDKVLALDVLEVVLDLTRPEKINDLDVDVDEQHDEGGTPAYRPLLNCIAYMSNLQSLTQARGQMIQSGYRPQGYPVWIPVLRTKGQLSLPRSQSVSQDNDPVGKHVDPVSPKVKSL
ncbi:hypothetical protein RJT34_05040 [Clitoria ternatea]|uniref:PB1-like domain-containing protein n=1 Tax=Clitoria ternatea TaxID=43366 RepID=A0AAN9PSE0_CLITE